MQFGSAPYQLSLVVGSWAACQGQVESLPSVPLLAANPDGPMTPTSSVREGLIHLDVSIPDPTGSLIRGPIPSDFTLFDNGQQAKILSLRPSDPASENERLTEVAVVLAMDLNRLRAFVCPGGSDLIKYLRRNDGHLPEPMSIYWLTSVGFFGSARPTADGDELAAEVARNFFPRAIWSRPQGTSLAAFADNNDNWNKSLHSLYALAVDWSEKPGRKALLWMGPGWPKDGMITGSSNADYPFTLLVELSSRTRDARMVIYQVSPWAETRNGEFAYTVYATGARSAKELEEGMRYFSLPVLALESGGMVLDEGLSVADEISKCIRDAGSFYTLSFDPPRTTRVDEYHDLKVSVAKPGAVARTNTGYYDQPAFYNQPRIPAQRVTVHQLRSRYSKARTWTAMKPIWPERLNALELTERLSSRKLESWLRRIRGQSVQGRRRQCWRMLRSF